MSSVITPAEERATSQQSDMNSPASDTESDQDVGRLLVLTGERTGFVYRLGLRTVVGRRTDCDLMLFEPSISRRHAMILRQADGYYLHDLSSQNGTFVNGKRLVAPTRLSDSDRIELDVISLVFRCGTQPGSVRIDPRPESDGRKPAGIVREMNQIDRPSNVVTAIQVGESIAARSNVNAEVKLRTVLGIARNLGRSTSCDEFLASVLESLFQVFPQCARGYVLVFDPATGSLREACIRQRRDDTDGEATVRPLARRIALRAMREGEALLCSDPAGGNSGDGDESILPIDRKSVV